MQQSGLSVVGSFEEAWQAELAKSRLEASELRAWLLDEHQIRLQPWYSGVLGGIKLAVHSEDAVRAREILSTAPEIGEAWLDASQFEATKVVDESPHRRTDPGFLFPVLIILLLALIVSMIYTWGWNEAYW